MATVLAVLIGVYVLSRMARSARRSARRTFGKLRLSTLLWGFLIGLGVAMALLHSKP